MAERRAKQHFLETERIGFSRWKEADAELAESVQLPEK